MNYVTHHRYKELALCGERLNIPYGTELHTEGYSLVLPDVENTEAMRYQIIFDGKPEPEVRYLLKSNGFKWAPSQGAWQRQITSNGRYALGKVIEKLKEMEETEQQ